MTKEERKIKLNTIANHLAMVVEDLVDYKYRLEEARFGNEAKLLDTITRKLYNLQWILSDKARG